MTQSEFRFYTERAYQKAVAFQADSAALQQVVREGVAVRQRTDALLDFATAAERLLPERTNDTRRDGGPVRRAVVNGSDGPSYVLLRRGPPQKGRGRLGLLLDSDSLAGVVRTVVSSEAPAGTGWSLRSSDRGLLGASDPAPAGPPTVTIGPSTGFPPWVLELYAPSASLADSFLAPRRRIYLYAFVLIAGILVFGLVLTGQTVSRELELARMKSDFIATVSHEFRSPLTAIRQLAAMLGSGQVPSEERRQRYHQILIEQSERLSHLVENVLESARLEERPDLDMKPVELGELVEEVSASAQQRVAHDGFQIVARVEADLPPARLDRETITRALGNLVDNAIKYSGESREVLVSGRQEDGHVVLSVRDWGHGLSEQERRRVFERFYRGGDEMTRSVPGSGLGLTLVKRVVEAHGGRVLVESTPGEGSTFSIWLPVGSTS